MDCNSLGQDILPLLLFDSEYPCNRELLGHDPHYETSQADLAITPRDLTNKDLGLASEEDSEHSEGTTGETNTTEDSDKPIGRPKDEETEMFNQFEKPLAMRPPTKYNVHTCFVRGFKAVIRVIEKDSVPGSAYIYGFDRFNTSAMAKFVQLKLFVSQHSYLYQIAGTETGPKSEGKSKRQPDNDTGHNSHSKANLQELFGRKETREAFGMFVELVFDCGDTELARKMKFRPKAVQKAARLSAWRQLKEYMSRGIFEHLFSRRKRKK